jgi:REP element-mobilizing transposase RayT
MESERTIVFDALQAGAGEFYSLVATVVMPDHVHAILKPREGLDLRRIMKGTKGSTARLINLERGVRGTVWLDESFDRIIRDQEELDEKLNYMLNNPAKHGLVEDGWKYRWWYFNDNYDNEI